MLNIYLNTWKNYNSNGAEGGDWITLPMEQDDLKEAMKKIADNMKDFDPEYFINDYEWIADIDYSISENESILELNQLLNDIDTLDTWELETLEAMIETGMYCDLWEAYENIENCTFYKSMDLYEVAYDIVNECYFTKDTPDFLTRYFDYEAFARDLHFDGYYEVSNGTIFIGY